MNCRGGKKGNRILLWSLHSTSLIDIRSRYYYELTFTALQCVQSCRLVYYFIVSISSPLCQFLHQFIESNQRGLSICSAQCHSKQFFGNFLQFSFSWQSQWQQIGFMKVNCPIFEGQCQIFWIVWTVCVCDSDTSFLSPSRSGQCGWWEEGYFHATDSN